MGWIIGKGIGVPFRLGGSGLGSSYWKTQSAFLMDEFDFNTNQLKDKSGNGNHATLKNASARLGNSAPVANTLLTNIIHSYSFDEPSGNLIDAVTGNNGTPTGGVTQGSVGKINRSYGFATNGRVVLGTPITFTTTDSFTISMWIKTNTIAAGAVMLMANAQASKCWLYRDGGNLVFMIRGSNRAGETYVTYADILTVGPWFHVICERNVSTDQINIWVNNVAAGAGVTDATTANITATLSFGARPEGTQAFNGNIDSLKIWRGVLSPEDKTALYNSGVGLEHDFSKGNPIDYAITGLLTTDTVEVIAGSDTPTIPYNGILRITGGQIVYGVTIKRAGVVWAVIPFCEPKACTENIPFTSYDVSGNGNHATCNELADANITIQNNYFYLQQYGYNIGGPDLIASRWNFGSWSGAYPDEVWAGLDSKTSGILEPVEGGLFKVTNPGQIRELNVNTIGKRYITEITVADKTVLGGSANQCAFKITNNGLINTTIGNTNTHRPIDKNGYHRCEALAISTTFEITTCGYGGASYSYIVTGLTLKEKQIVPALLAGINDALNRTLEFVPDGITWFQYGCELEFPDNALLKAADQKGYWSDLITGGYLINGETYLIETTEADHFGAGKVIHNEFTSDGSEYTTRNNTVRQLIKFSGNRGLLYNDTGAAIALNYDDVRAKRQHFMYCQKNFHEDVNYYHYDYGYIKDLVVFKSTFFASAADNLTFITRFGLQQETDTTYIVFSYDASENTASMDRIRTIFNDRKINFTQMINYGNTLSKANVQTLMADGNEIGLHTGVSWQTGTFLASYKDFHEVIANYTEGELTTYWEECKAYYLAELGITLQNHAYPGGSADAMSLGAILNYFRSGRGASGSGYYNKLPLKNMAAFSSLSLDVIATSLASYEAYVDEYISYKNLGNFYGHYTASDWSETDWTNFEAFLDYIIAKQAAGDLIRIAVVDDALDIIENKK